MKLQAEHHFDHPPQDVAAAMVDPDFAPRLIDLPDVGDVEVIGSGGDRTARWLSVRMIYDGSIDPIAARILGSSTPSWIQTYRLEPDGRSGTLTISPEHHESLLRCHAAITLDDTGPGTRRTTQGELSVRVPLLGGRAERSLGPAILARIDVEATLLAEWLSSPR